MLLMEKGRPQGKTVHLTLALRFSQNFKASTEVLLMK